ncbi:cytochrome P450 [Nocardia brasiliensis]|uniref:Cytochrome P450 n=1 Tax=Nocardia brasiliensis TaxID=37326 RepID=A0A6G9XTH1_NOCBR|nr:cytochrome P450 [Nocardia brasiliensis]QIS04224.1 cytochrome P450 [Nocardia brasiliensis]
MTAQHHARSAETGSDTTPSGRTVPFPGISPHPSATPRRRRRISTLGRTVDPALPGPKGRPVVGVLPEFRRDPFESVRGWARTYGDVFHVPLPLWNLVMVNHPDLVNQVMNDRDGRFSMVGPGEQPIARTIGSALPMMEGDRFRRRRRMLTPMFGRRHLARIADTIVDEFVQRIERWDHFADTGTVVDLQHEIAQVTLPAFLRAMYSTKLSDDRLAQVDVDMRLLMRAVAAAALLSNPPNPLPIPGTNNLPMSVYRLSRLVSGLIDDRLAHPSEQTDLLGLLLDSRYDDGTGLSRRDLRAELIALMGGGYETVVASLSHTLAHLCTNPEPAQRLFDEIDELDGATPTLDDLSRLTWAKACFDEGQRLQGHPMNPRLAVRDSEIAGFHIPRGTLVGTPVYTVHRDERWWRAPDSYDPTRFTASDHPARPNNAFIPFGAGPHHCIGSGMAYMNAQFLLTLIFQRYRLHTEPGWRPRHASTFSITLDGGLPVRLSRVRKR